MSRAAYVLIYTGDAGPRAEVRDYLDGRPEILNWYHCLPNTFFVVSDRTATYLADMFAEFTQGRGYFLVLDANTEKNGRMPPDAWDMLNHPRPAPGVAMLAAGRQ